MLFAKQLNCRAGDGKRSGRKPSLRPVSSLLELLGTVASTGTGIEALRFLVAAVGLPWNIESP